MSNTLSNLLHRKGELLRKVSQRGDFQPGSVTTVRRRCGKPNCHWPSPPRPATAARFS
jgi:hypothetical protein